ncbi:Paired amphipathic helix protein Sin3 [Corchorus olitorius]|uniref:Paired amphipathic helix protein Sin3 n=1 Tax=Corchorus olitorius TaxID=93759 RepID=A0A1R3KEL9_9ROSI|nr:Paired amphipathic helix protein Sin3 [Corchorus olitorius]
MDRGNNWRIVDLVVLNGKIYFLTTDREIRTLNLNPQNTSRRYNHLLSSKGELYVGEFCGVRVLVEIHRLNFETKKWEKVVFEETLCLLSNVKSIGYKLPRPSTKICFFKDPNRGFYLEEMEKCWLQLGNSLSVIPDMEKIKRDSRRVPWRYPSRKRRNFFEQPIWYFPHLSTKVDPVYEDKDLSLSKYIYIYIYILICWTSFILVL